MYFCEQDKVVRLGITIKGFAVKILQRTTRICFPRAVPGLKNYLSQMSDCKSLLPLLQLDTSNEIIFLDVHACVQFYFIILSKKGENDAAGAKARSFTFVQISNFAGVRFLKLSTLHPLF